MIGNCPVRRYDMKSLLLPDGFVVVHSQTTNWVYSLSPLAGLIWEFCDGGNSLAQIMDKVSALSGVDISLEQAEQLLNQLVEAELLLTSPASTNAHRDGMDLSPACDSE
jgi:Coenzyme PQQ synthesis protein D (PqqD)